MRTPINNGILLEAGTNELEILEFKIAEQSFGINVSKVREILTFQSLTSIPHVNEFIEGIFMPRDVMITVVDLGKYLELPASKRPEYDLFIITNFNNLALAFHVHTVVGIARISWKSIQKPDRIIFGSEAGVATGIAEYEGRLITILDFEKIISEICPETSIQVSDVEKLGERHAKQIPLLLVEDSALLGNIIFQSLNKAGYKNVTKMDNGQEAYDYLMHYKELGEYVKKHVACVITDIEMPRMDGLHLTKLIKEDAEMKEIPVVLFSSLINDDMRVKGETVGADAQISKPQINDLIVFLDRLTLNG